MATIFVVRIGNSIIATAFAPDCILRNSMPIYQAVILAIVQGITEFLPVSSSAHLALAPWLFGWKDQGLTFDIALHFGTLLAVLFYFARDWAQIFAQAFGINYSPDPDLRLNRTMLWLLALASLPIGFSVSSSRSRRKRRSAVPIIIGTMLIVVGLVMWYADRDGTARSWHRQHRSYSMRCRSDSRRRSQSFPVRREAASPSPPGFSAGSIATRPAAFPFCSRRPPSPPLPQKLPRSL